MNQYLFMKLNGPALNTPAAAYAKPAILNPHGHPVLAGGGHAGSRRHAARQPVRVRVHDARGIAEAASGRNGGFALGGGAARYDVARETYGAERSAAFWRWT